MMWASELHAMQSRQLSRSRITPNARQPLCGLSLTALLLSGLMLLSAPSIGQPPQEQTPADAGQDAPTATTDRADATLDPAPEPTPDPTADKSSEEVIDIAPGDQPSL